MADVEFIVLVIMLLITGPVYCAFNYLTKTKPGEFQMKRFIASLLFGIIIGGLGIYMVETGSMVINDMNFWAFIGTLFMTYQGMQMYLNGFIDWVWLKFSGAKIGG